jgi:hypothetical protein
MHGWHSAISNFSGACACDSLYTIDFSGSINSGGDVTGVYHYHQVAGGRAGGICSAS